MSKRTIDEVTTSTSSTGSNNTTTTSNKQIKTAEDSCPITTTTTDITTDIDSDTKENMGMNDVNIADNDSHSSEDEAEEEAPELGFMGQMMGGMGKLNELMDEDGPMIQCVVIATDGSTTEETIDMTPKKNNLATLIGGQTTFLGQYDDINVVACALRDPSVFAPLNTYTLPPPLHTQDVKGKVVLMRMNESAYPETFTLTEWNTYKEQDFTEFKAVWEARDKAEEEANAAFEAEMAAEGGDGEADVEEALGTINEDDDDEEEDEDFNPEEVEVAGDNNDNDEANIAVEKDIATDTARVDETVGVVEENKE